MSNPTPHNLEVLRTSLAAEIKANGGPANVAAYAAGAVYATPHTFDRDRIADVCDAHGFTAAATRARDIAPERALAEAVRARAATLCTSTARAESSKQEMYAFHVEALEPDEANKHLRAWGVYRERRLPGERSGKRDIMGARCYVSPAGIYAAKPLDGAGNLREFDPACAAIAQEIVDHAQVLLRTLDNTLMSRVLDAVYDAAGAFTWIAAGTKIVMPGPRADALVDCVLALKAQGVPANVVPLFRGGLTEQGVTESLVRDLERQIDEAVRQLADDAQGGRVRASTVLKRRDELQAQVDRVKQYRSLLQGWDETLAGKLSALRDAYDRAKDDTAVLELPDWAGGPAAPTAPAPASAPAAPRRARKSKATDGNDPFAI